MEQVSVIVPIYNEEKNIPVLFERLGTVLADYDYEVIAVNDGSSDDSLAELRKVAASNNRFKVVNFVKNYGQTAAINAGIQHATKDVFVLIDSDLENDPADIPRLIDKLEEGYDVVSGWRKNRWKGQFLTRKLPSKMANMLISFISGVKLHDYGCTLKAYRREIIEDVMLYGEMHRFIPIYSKWNGGRITEMEVNYQPRQHGKSNYGIGRTYKVMLDLVLIKFLDKYMTKPMHFFGGAGLLSMFLGVIAGALALYFKISTVNHKDLVETPLPTICGLFLMMGVLFILMGVVTELLMRTYFESQGKSFFKIRERLNFSPSQVASLKSKNAGFKEVKDVLHEESQEGKAAADL